MNESFVDKWKVHREEKRREKENREIDTLMAKPTGDWHIRIENWVGPNIKFYVPGLDKGVMGSTVMCKAIDGKIYGTYAIPNDKENGADVGNEEKTEYYKDPQELIFVRIYKFREEFTNGRRNYIFDVDVKRDMMSSGNFEVVYKDIDAAKEAIEKHKSDDDFHPQFYLLGFVCIRFDELKKRYVIVDSEGVDVNDWKKHYGE